MMIYITHRRENAMDQMSALVFLLLTVCIGYFAAKTGLISDHAGDGFVQLLFNICYPAMILETFATVDVSVLLGTGLPVLVATAIVTLAVFALCLPLYRKLPGDQRALLILMTTVGNVTYVATPMFSVFLGAEAVMVAVINCSAQDPIVWGINHPMMLKSKSGSNNFVKEVLGNPCLVATAVGIVIVALGIKIPGFLLDTVSKIAATTTPIALLLVGMLIKQYGMFSWIHDKKALLYSAVKVLVMPVIIFAVLTPFLELKTTILLAFLFGTPGPLLAVAWAKKYDVLIEFAIHSFICSTLLYLLLGSPLMLLLAPYLT